MQQDGLRPPLMYPMARTLRAAPSAPHHNPL
jgi:hypothetical protein